MLPGREIMVETAALAGLEQPWRPISMTPMRTLASLLSLLPVFAVVAAGGRLGRDDHRRLLVAILIGLAASLLLSLLQISGSAVSAASLYAITTPEFPTGLFANRNHNALLLALGLPLSAAFAAIFFREAGRNVAARGIVLASPLLLVPAILATGSRAGILLATAGFLGSSAIFLSTGDLSTGDSEKRKERKNDRRTVAATVGVAIVAGVAMAMLSRAASFERLVFQASLNEQRSETLGPIMSIAMTYFPIGSGFGSFEHIFKIYEPFSNLSLNYLNHAHNDFVQIYLEGGLVALVILAGFALWLMKAGYRAWRQPHTSLLTTTLARTGSVGLVMVAIASAVDYPLRTSLIAIVTTLFVVWIAAPAQPFRK